MGLLEALLLFCIRWLRWIPLLIVLLCVGLHILPIWIDFCMTEVNWRGLPAPQDVNVCPKLVHSSTSCGVFTRWRRPRLRRRSGMLGLTRSFWDWHRCSFRALRGMSFRATPLHSATNRGPESAESMAYGDRENLKSFTSILSANGATRLRLLTLPFSQKPITCASNICHTHRSHVQGLLVN